MPGIASAATAVVIGHVAGGTQHDPRRLRRHHAAEPLAAGDRRAVRHAGRRCIPGRIDLGLGRAPGTDHADARARCAAILPTAPTSFPQDVHGAAALLRPGAAGPARSAPCPAPGSRCRSGCWARACSARSSRRMLGPAVRVRLAFRARRADAGARASTARASSRRQQLERPYAMLGVNVIAADTDERGAPSLHVAAAVLRQSAARTPGQLPPPIDDIEPYWSPAEKAMRRARAGRARSSDRRETVERGLEEFIEATQRGRDDGHRRTSSISRRGCARSPSRRKSGTGWPRK